jgi:molecular chaperone GrpE
MDHDQTNTTGSENNISDNGPPDALMICEKTREEYLSGWQRAKADLINYKNEEGRRLEDIARFVIKSLISDILPVLDSFERAIQLNSPDHNKGVLLIQTQLLDVFKKRGLDIVDAKPGEAFNPQFHESLDEIPSDHPPGSIAAIAQKGYAYKDHIIRPARVRISKNTQENPTKDV